MTTEEKVQALIENYEERIARLEPDNDDTLSGKISNESTARTKGMFTGFVKNLKKILDPNE